MARYDLTAEEFATWLEARVARMRALADDLELVRIVQRIAMEKAEMNRLQEKLAKAGGVVARQSAKIEARADAIIAREDAIEAKTNDAFSGHEAILSETERGLEGLERQLALMSNGAPLEPSDDSAASPQPVPAQGQQTAFTAPVGFDMRPGAVNRVDPQTVAIPPGDARKFDRMG